MKPGLRRFFGGLLFLQVWAPGAGEARAVEGTPLAGKGLTLRLVSDSAVVAPGSKVTVGLFIEHEPGYHTYWRSPGVVGMATSLNWDLPERAEASGIRWPGPMRTKMAQVTAWGYEEDTCLMTEIQVPENFSEKAFRVGVEVAWMCCARSCYPGFERLEITFPVGPTQVGDERWSDVVAAAGARVPLPCPTDWEFTVIAPAAADDGIFEVVFELPASLEVSRGFRWNEVYFFCDDNQVDSDARQKVRPDPECRGRVSLLLRTTAFAPDEPEVLSGVLFHPGGWPGLGTCWIRVEAGWNRQ